jgi:hypothetical protein
MNQEKIDLCKYELEKAKKTLETAKANFKGKDLISTVNRIYYAMFYSATAVLMTKGLSSSKHSGVMSNFDKNIVNKGLIDKDYGKFYHKIFAKRNWGDYEPFSKFEEKEVNDWLAKAEEFIKTMEELTLKIID